MCKTEATESGRSELATIFVLTYEMVDNCSELVAVAADRAALVARAASYLRWLGRRASRATRLATQPSIYLGDFEELRITEVELLA